MSAEERRRWREAYDRYLQTPYWQEKRRLVLRRANGFCEGCLKNKATQVHHTCYPKDSKPGSRDWIRKEKLFHLVAICSGCHQDLHPTQSTAVMAGRSEGTAE